MKICLFVLALCGLVNAHALTLAEAGAPRAAIVTALGASEADKNAARELRRYLNEVTGGDFPIVESAATDLPLRIYVGQSDEVKKLAPQVDWARLKSDDIVMQTVKDGLVLAGGRPRGTLYAVYQFLQEVVGCDWWTSTASTIPRKPDLSIPELSVIYSPPLFYRDIYAKDVVRNSAFAAQMRRNGTTGEAPNAEILSREWGGTIQIAGHVHTFDKFLPASKYAKDHPEWGSLIRGQRRPWGQFTGQLCLSNPELVAKFKEAVLEKINEYPHSRIISVSMNDNTYRCECDQCLAIEKEEGSMSGPMIRFVNQIAAAVAETHPDLYVETLAYLYTMKPPKLVKPGPNVMIRFTTFTDDHRLPFSKNPRVVEKAKSWADISSQLFVWDYQPDFHNAWKVRPNILNMAENISFFRKYKAEGYFMEAEERPTDFTELRTWLASQLLWNPAADGDKMIRRFLDGYYGKAGEPMFAYLKLMRDELPAADTLMSGFGPSRLPYSASTLNKASALFDEAAARVAQDEVLSRRVARERLALDYLRIYRYPEFAAEDEQKQLFPNDAAAIAASEKFLADVQALGIPLKQAAGFGINPHNATEAAAELKLRAISKNRPPTGLPPNTEVVTIPATHFSLWGYGSTVTLANDTAAEIGLAARIVNKGEAWAVQFDIPASLLGRKWKVFIQARVEGTKPGTFSVGVFDRLNYQTPLSRQFTLKPSPKFQTLALGEIEFVEGSYIYVSPATPYSPDTATLIERIYLMKP